MTTGASRTKPIIKTATTKTLQRRTGNDSWLLTTKKTKSRMTSKVLKV